MERKKFFTQRTSTGQRPETFAIRVEDYDTSGSQLQHKVRGVRLDSGETVEVSLRKIEYNQKGRFKRSEIADFAAPRKDRNHPGTSAGGTLLIQEGFKQPDGSFAARWIQSLSHTPGEAEVFTATVHVSPVKYGGAKTAEMPDGRPYSQMTVLHDGDFSHVSPEMADALKLTPPFKVDSVGELREAITEILNDGLGIGVRVSTPEGFDAMYVRTPRDSTIDDSVAAFMKDVEPMADAIGSGEAVCEVIAYGNTWAGPATVDVMQENTVVMSRLKQFNAENHDNQGRAHPVMVFRPAIVAARLTKPDANGNRSVFFSHFEPLYTRQPVHGMVNALCYAQTEHLSPEPPKLNAPTQSEPAQGPDAGESAGSFDGGMDSDLDTGLMDAAANVGNDFIGDEMSGAASEPAPTKPATRGRYAGRARA